MKTICFELPIFEEFSDHTAQQIMQRNLRLMFEAEKVYIKDEDGKITEYLKNRHGKVGIIAKEEQAITPPISNLLPRAVTNAIMEMEP